MTRSLLQLEEQVAARAEVFKVARNLVGPIIEKHGLTRYQVGGSIITPGSSVTEVDQSLDAITRVADWLMEDIS